ncbi:uncharacterized protein LOC115737071 [Rhodamnia argentea]|uniref:Uncharacterized protein LOC115737071 n=1 Tax=Rhodamnia argentea TaxID=178133 RepID=A0A8B8NQV0_9MYRT|nr:uncharacterized protein LOC115737071 [Rhodamnia argentea]
MAASSAAHNATAPASIAGVAGGNRTEAPPKTLRGLNKPKCIQCGNVARSRCPYQSCKSCCSKAQNPCHIHVLKANATFPDKTPPSSSPIFSQQATEQSPSGSSLRVASLRQLSNNFSQFNNVQMPLRTKKPLTRKDAAAINEWRFAKLKEFKDRHIEVEDESFDRYMQNVSLLEDVFALESLAEGSGQDESPTSIPGPACGEEKSIVFSEMKLKLKANPVRKENLRKRIHGVIDEGLRKLQKLELNNQANDSVVQGELINRPKIKGFLVERALIIHDLNEKLNKARNEEDLKSCLDMQAQLISQHVGSGETVAENTKPSLPAHAAEDDKKMGSGSAFSLPKSVSTAEIDQETLNIISSHFSSLEQIENL